MADIVSEVYSHQMFRINSGAVQFKVQALYCKFWLVGRNPPYKQLYQICIGSTIIIKNLSNDNEVKLNLPQQHLVRHETFIQYLLSWFNGCIQISSPGQQQVYIEYRAEDLDYHNQIGFINFHIPTTNHSPVRVEIEAPPFNPKPAITKQIEEGKLNWVQMTGSQLPPGALIGGFENELTYIARAYHNGSLCPGRYIPSKGIALIPWGYSAHIIHENLEILCGYNAVWIKTKSNLIPDNAFIAGFSEVHHEPLYIGRAMYKGNLLTGKVHTLYKTCYLPYERREIEMHSYEILVMGHLPQRSLQFIDETI